MDGLPEKHKKNLLIISLKRLVLTLISSGNNNIVRQKQLKFMWKQPEHTLILIFGCHINRYNKRVKIRELLIENLEKWDKQQ